MELELQAVLGVGACGRAGAGGEAPGKWAGRDPDVSASARWRAHSGRRMASQRSGTVLGRNRRCSVMGQGLPGQKGLHLENGGEP